jgi:DNA replication protein DnaC
MQGTKDPKNIERVLKYCDNLKENLSEGKGFIFVGTKGNGKSNAAICIAKECIKKQYSALFITSLDMFDHINAAITDGTTIEARIKELISIDLLVIDEIVAKMTDGDHKTLFKIINGRWEYKKSTILTSNLDIKSDNPNEITLKSTLGERIMDRLRDKNTCLRFTGESLRGK